MILHPTYKIWNTELLSIRDSMQKPLSVLDYGCGNGVIVNLVGKNYFAKYLGMDTSIDAINFGTSKYKNNPNISFQLIKPNQMPRFGEKSSWDIIILVGVFQYLTDREIDYIVSESSKTLKSGGKLIFSTILDTGIYRYLNAYQFVFPNRYINRKSLTSKLNKFNFSLELDKARGLLIGPLVSHIFVIPFDAIDHFVLGVRGKIGFLGSLVRIAMYPFMYMELLIPINFGYTWYAIAKKLK